MDDVFLRDLDGTGSMHVCAEGDPDAVAYTPVQFWPASSRLLMNLDYNTEKKIDRLWRDHGGDQHGPHVETMTIPRSKFFAFLEAFKSSDLDKT